MVSSALERISALSRLLLLAAELTALDVAYAGSMGSLMEGALKKAVEQTLKLELHGRSQGANPLAQLIVSGSIRPDVFVPITPGPMLTVLRSGKAEVAQPIARTEMVVAYSPKSRFAPQLDVAAAGKAKWWEILQQPGFRFGRSDSASEIECHAAHRSGQAATQAGRANHGNRFALLGVGLIVER